MEITLSSVLTKMRLLYTDYRMLSIAVEGGSDRVFYELNMGKDNISYKVMNGYENVLKLVELANQAGDTFLMGIIDLDLHTVSKNTGHEKGCLKNIYYTDKHDIEIELFESPALEKVLKISGSEDKCKNCGDIRGLIYKRAISIGAFRFISVNLRFNMDFDEIKYEKFICKKTLDLDLKALVRYIFAKSSSAGGHNCTRTPAEIEDMIAKMIKSDLDNLIYCNGHDVITILSIGLQSFLGSNGANDVEPEKVFEKLLLAYEQSYFQMTALFKDTKCWLGAHSPSPNP